MRLGAQPFLWKWVLFAWEWKMISISKAEHLPSFWNRGPWELGNGLLRTQNTKTVSQADKSSNKAHTVMIKLAMYSNICLAFNLFPNLFFANDFRVPCKFAPATRTGREGGGGNVSPRKTVVQSACQYDVTSRISDFQSGEQSVHRRGGWKFRFYQGNTVPISWIWRF